MWPEPALVNEEISPTTQTLVKPPSSMFLIWAVSWLTVQYSKLSKRDFIIYCIQAHRFRIFVAAAPPKILKLGQVPALQSDLIATTFLAQPRAQLPQVGEEL